MNVRATVLALMATVVVLIIVSLAIPDDAADRLRDVADWFGAWGDS